jgi:predicted nucleic acid-binding protein
MFLLDTNVVSELRKVCSDPGVIDWVAGVPSDLMFISSITLQELEVGVLLAERADPPQGVVLRRWLDYGVALAFEGRVLAVDGTVSRRAATFHVPDPAPFRDALIGATAAVHGMTVVTRNEKDFVRFGGVDVVNPWR